MPQTEFTTDLLVVGSGAGVVGALRASALGLETLVVEKQALFGGSTCLSGGVIWLPDNPLMRREGVPDSVEAGLEYFESVVGDVGPASSPARRRAYIHAGSDMVEFLENEGLRFQRLEGYSDYYAGVRGVRAGVSRGRAIEAQLFDKNLLGPVWRDRLPTGWSDALNAYVGEGAALKAPLTPGGRAALANARQRTEEGLALGERRVTGGAALSARLLHALLVRGIPVWLGSPLEELVVDDGRVTGAVIRRQGERIRVHARHGVLIAAGGFARNAEMRAAHSPERVTTSAWTSANPGDTGEAIRAGIEAGAATGFLDEAWWMPSWIAPDGTPQMCSTERTKPGSLMVDQGGHRYFNEATSYMDAGQQMLHREQTVGGAIPSWLILDSWHRDRYPLGPHAPGDLPEDLLASGAVIRADSLAQLAEAIDVDAEQLSSTVERFNALAEAGVDSDFHRGEGAHERYYGDPTHGPNPCLAPLTRAPYYAVAVYPGDLGTSGGLLADEHGRVLSADGSNPIPGLYATGNSTASVMGRSYLGSGASVGASSIFSFVAATHAAALP